MMLGLNRYRLVAGSLTMISDTIDIPFTGYHRAVDLWRKETHASWGILMVSEINAQAIEDFRKISRARGRVPSYTAIAIKAIAQAIAEQKAHAPFLNGYLRSFMGFKQIKSYSEIACGYSKALERDGQELILPGLITTPEKKTAMEITEEIRTQTTSPDEKRLREVAIFYRLPSLLQRLALWVGAYFPKLRFETRGSFNFTSVGHLGVDWHSLPQSSALQFSMGLVRDRVFAVDGKPVVAKGFELVCSMDRRLMSGTAPAGLMARVREILTRDIEAWEVG